MNFEFVGNHTLPIFLKLHDYMVFSLYYLLLGWHGVILVAKHGLQENETCKRCLAVVSLLINIYCLGV